MKYASLGRPEVVVTVSFLLIESAKCFTASNFGIGAVLFPVRGSELEYISCERDSYQKRIVIADASDFFVDSFWTGKVGGGAKTLTQRQRQNLQQSQIAEFTKRYGSSSSSSINNRRLSELIICRDNKKKNEIIGCVGAEVDRIPDGYVKGPTVDVAPLMSNLAISKLYRRRGLAEKLVLAVENMVRKEWGYDACYLYVEERNSGAVALYKKLGYRALWKDSDATTLLPTSDGDLRSSPTVLICMKKDLSNRNIFEKIFIR